MKRKLTIRLHQALLFRARSRTPSWLSLGIIGFFLAVLGCATTPPAPSYLAKVNQDIITMEDLKQEFKRRHAGHERFLIGEVEIRRFLGNVIDQRLLIQEAYQLGLHEEFDIRQAVDDFQRQQVSAYLIKKEVEEKSKATDEEIRNVYEEKLVELLQVQQIVVESQGEAEAILVRIKAGEDFEAIAREKSIAPSRKYGGRLYPVGWGAMDPEWERIAFGLSVGELSPVFKSGMGYEIIRLTSKETPPKPEFDKVRQRIKGALERRKLQERKKELPQFLRNKYNVRFMNSDLNLDHLKEALEEKKEEPLAIWNGGKLTLYSFASKLKIEMFEALPPSHVKNQIQTVLEEWVIQTLVEKEAFSRGYEKIPEISDKVRQYREDLMENHLYGKYILSDFKITEEDLKQYFEQNQKDFFFPERRKIAHIMVESMETAREILKKHREGEPFENLARDHSKDIQSKNRGGDIGWFVKGQILPPFEKVAFSSQAGEVSDPVQTEFGFHLIKVVEIQPARPKDFSQAREEIEKKVGKKKRDDKIKFWTEKLKKVSQVEINEEAIKVEVAKIEEEIKKIQEKIEKSEKSDKALDKKKVKN